MVSENSRPIAILGAGSWGTAIALLLARNGHEVLLWDFDPGHIAEISAAHCNARYLPDNPLPDLIRPCAELSQVVASVRDIYLVVPSIGFRDTLEKIAGLIRDDTRLAWATKGFDPVKGCLLHEVVDELLGKHIPHAVISGPSFASEVAAGLPTAVTVAANNPDFAMELSRQLHNDCFRAYTSTDIIGVEVGGAVKNVLAIAAGIGDGLKFGANTRAALVTRGLAEIMRLGVALGGHSETFMGLAGLGDLVLTCTDDQSRNRRLGLALAGGENLQEALASIGQVAEGAQTVREVMQLAQKHGVEMPITEQVYQVLYEGRDPRDAVIALFSREPKPEVD